MKKIIILLMCFLMVLSTVIGASDTDQTTDGDTTDYIPYDEDLPARLLYAVDGKTCSDLKVDKRIGPTLRGTSGEWCVSNTKDFGIAVQVFTTSNVRNIRFICWTKRLFFITSN